MFLIVPIDAETPIFNSTLEYILFTCFSSVLILFQSILHNLEDKISLTISYIAWESLLLIFSCLPANPDWLCWLYVQNQTQTISFFVCLLQKKQKGDCLVFPSRSSFNRHVGLEGVGNRFMPSPLSEISSQCQRSGGLFFCVLYVLH